MSVCCWALRHERTEPPLRVRALVMTSSLDLLPKQILNAQTEAQETQRTSRKCHADEPLAVQLDGLHFDDKLQVVEEPIEITDREVKRVRAKAVSH
ncbi:hypothetical protein Tco_1437512 [Tanacetum coccineum]